MAMIEKANGNDDIARALHLMAARSMANIRSTCDVGTDMRKLMGEATGMSPDYPPMGWTNEDCLAAVNRGGHCSVGSHHVRDTRATQTLVEVQVIALNALWARW